MKTKFPKELKCVWGSTIDTCPMREANDENYCHYDLAAQIADKLSEGTPYAKKAAQQASKIVEQMEEVKEAIEFAQSIIDVGILSWIASDAENPPSKISTEIAIISKHKFELEQLQSELHMELGSLFGVKVNC